MGSFLLACSKKETLIDLSLTPHMLYSMFNNVRGMACVQKIGNFKMLLNYLHHTQFLISQLQKCLKVNKTDICFHVIKHYLSYIFYQYNNAKV